jgi:hypothetical protein
MKHTTWYYTTVYHIALFICFSYLGQQFHSDTGCNIVFVTDTALLTLTSSARKRCSAHDRVFLQRLRRASLCILPRAGCWRCSIKCPPTQNQRRSNFFRIFITHCPFLLLPSFATITFLFLSFVRPPSNPYSCSLEHTVTGHLSKDEQCYMDFTKGWYRNCVNGKTSRTLSTNLLRKIRMRRNVYMIW